MIYFDMDGVLADFNKHVLELIEDPVCLDQQQNSHQDDEKIWEAIRSDPHFYLNLEPISEGVNLFYALWKRTDENCAILSALPKPHRNIPNADSDKRAWAKKYLPKDVQVNLVTRADKPLFCKSKNDVLIDDRKDNIENWEKMGGTGILFTKELTLSQAMSLLTDQHIF